MNFLKVINLIQKKSLGTCFPLTFLNCNKICNTRPISLYKKDGSIFKYNNYTVFRVEKIICDTVKLRALVESNNSFSFTSIFVIVCPKDFCVIRSFPDTSIACI